MSATDAKRAARAAAGANAHETDGRHEAAHRTPDSISYHGLPLLKGPVWTWEVPAYFFVGGAAGAAAVLAFAAQSAGTDEDLVRDARWIAAAGATVSTPLLIADLGRPERFLNMLRVFKLQSPMSVGAWTLALFGAASTAAVVADLLSRRSGMRLTFVVTASSAASAATGMVMATYTGVLLGATAIPLWKHHVRLLPVHFGASALASAVSLLELRGHRNPSLNALGLGATLFETLVNVSLEGDDAQESRPLREGRSGELTRIAGLLSGPIPLVCRIVGARRAAALSTLAGSLLTRFAWVEGGKVSARDVGVSL